MSRTKTLLTAIVILVTVILLSSTNSSAKPGGTFSPSHNFRVAVLCTGADWIYNGFWNFEGRSPICDQSGPIGPFVIRNMTDDNVRVASCLQKRGEARRCWRNTWVVSYHGAVNQGYVNHGQRKDTTFGFIDCLPTGHYIYSWYVDVQPTDNPPIRVPDNKRFNGHRIAQRSFQVYGRPWMQGMTAECSPYTYYRREFHRLSTHLPKFNVNSADAKAWRKQHKAEQAAQAQ